MAIDRNTKIKDLIKNPQALAIVKKHVPVFDETNKGMKAAYNTPLKAFISFPQTEVSPETRKILIEELEAANIE